MQDGTCVSVCLVLSCLFGAVVRAHMTHMRQTMCPPGGCYVPQVAETRGCRHLCCAVQGCCTARLLPGCPAHTHLVCGRLGFKGFWCKKLQTTLPPTHPVVRQVEVRDADIFHQP